MREETAYKLTEAGKRILGGVCKRGYIEATVEETLRQIGAPDKAPQLLRKVRGKVYATDVRNLKAILEIDEAEADRDAFLVQEAAVWQEFVRLCAAYRIEEAARAQLMEQIRTAVIVEETPKIRVEAVQG